MRDEAFEEEEQSTVTPHCNFYRCTKQTTGGAFSNGRVFGIHV